MTVDQSQVSEAAARHSSVVRVSAQDPEGGAVTFSIMSGDPGAVFTMGESTGEIRVMGDMDREAREQYELVSAANMKIYHYEPAYSTVEVLVVCKPFIFIP